MINSISAQDISAALKAGFSDFLTRPIMSGFFGLFYAALGILIVWLLVSLGQSWLVIPVLVGFPLIAPFAAAGLYEISRRLEKNESFSWSDILSVMLDQRNREMGWMAFVTLFVFWIWVYQIRLLLAVILQDLSFSDFDGFLNAVLFTSEGWLFLTIGTGVGAVLCAVLFSITVVSMPMLLDRDVDFITAMVTSVRVVTKSPRTMLTWALIITITMLLSLVPAFLGLIFSLPILGHATWHLYRRAISPQRHGP